MKNIYHEGKLINKAGVDRVVLSHVELKKINWPVFKKAITALSDIIYDAFRSANRTYYVTEGGDRLHYMTITDPEVGHLNFGANPKKYGIIEFSPANKNNGINIVNFDGKELMEYLQFIMLGRTKAQTEQIMKCQNFIVVLESKKLKVKIGH